MCSSWAPRMKKPPKKKKKKQTYQKSLLMRPPSCKLVKRCVFPLACSRCWLKPCRRQTPQVAGVAQRVPNFDRLKKVSEKKSPASISDPHNMVYAAGSSKTEVLPQLSFNNGGSSIEVVAQSFLVFCSTMEVARLKLFTVMEAPKLKCFTVFIHQRKQKDVGLSRLSFNNEAASMPRTARSRSQPGDRLRQQSRCTSLQCNQAIQAVLVFSDQKQMPLRC